MTILWPFSADLFGWILTLLGALVVYWVAKFLVP